MPLVIKPVRLNKSIYIRVPKDLADLIGLSKIDEFNLSFQGTDQEFRLIYSKKKPTASKTDQRIARPMITNHAIY